MTGQAVPLIGCGVIERGIHSQYVTGDECGIYRVYEATTHTFIQVYIYILLLYFV